MPVTAFGAAATSTHTGGSGLSLVATPASGPAPLFVNFDATPPNGTQPTWSWSFGDGSYWNGSGTNYEMVVHDYERAGSFLAQVTATWSSGSLEANATIVVEPSNLAVAINASPSTGTVPLTVEFEARPSGGSGTYVSFLWSFGDGSVGSGPSVRYTFLQPGTFEVRVNVSDSGHRNATASATVVASSVGSGAHLNNPGGGRGATLLGMPVASAVAAIALGAGLTILGVSVVWVWQARRRSTPGPAAPTAPIGEATAPPSLSSGTAGAVRELAANLSSPLPTIGLPSAEAPNAPAPRGWAAPAPSPMDYPSGSETATGGRQLASQLLRHLEGLPRPAPGELPSRDWTQAGLAEALGVGQSAVSKVLRRLGLAGVVVSETGHVRGSARRVRVYRLTPRGEQLARALRGPEPRRSAAEPRR